MNDEATRLEREIEARRAEVEQTLESIREHLSVDRIVEEVGSFLGIEDMGGAVRAAGESVRRNPLPYAMVGAGLLWLMFGPDGSGASSRDGQGPGRIARRAAGAVGAATGEIAGEAGDAAARAASAVSGAVEGVAGAVTQAAGTARDAVGRTVGRAQHAVGEAGHALADAGRTFGRTWVDRAREQPLLFGAGALVLGTIVGAALPQTRAEERVLAPGKRRLVDEAKAAGREVSDRAARAARETYEAARRAAREEGLVAGDGSSIAERVERVAVATVEEAKAQVTGEADPDARPDDARGEESDHAPSRRRSR